MHYSSLLGKFPHSEYLLQTPTVLFCVQCFLRLIGRNGTKRKAKQQNISKTQTQRLGLTPSLLFGLFQAVKGELESLEVRYRSQFLLRHLQRFYIDLIVQKKIATKQHWPRIPCRRQNIQEREKKNQKLQILLVFNQIHCNAKLFNGQREGVISEILKGTEILN